MIQTLLLALGIILSLVHYLTVKSKTSRLRKPLYTPLLYKYWLVFAVGFNWVFLGCERLFYSLQLAQTFNSPLISSAQFDICLYSLCFGILGLIAPFASRGFRAAVITGFSLFTIATACVQLTNMLPTETYRIADVVNVSYNFAAPLILIILFFTGEKKKLF